jgi:hypothetical protein
MPTSFFPRDGLLNTKGSFSQNKIKIQGKYKEPKGYNLNLHLLESA